MTEKKLFNVMYHHQNGKRGTKREISRFQTNIHKKGETKSVNFNISKMIY